MDSSWPHNHMSPFWSTSSSRSTLMWQGFCEASYQAEIAVRRQCAGRWHHWKFGMGKGAGDAAGVHYVGQAAPLEGLCGQGQREHSRAPPMQLALLHAAALPHPQPLCRRTTDGQAHVQHPKGPHKNRGTHNHFAERREYWLVQSCRLSACPRTGSSHAQAEGDTRDAIGSRRHTHI